MEQKPDHAYKDYDLLTQQITAAIANGDVTHDAAHNQLHAQTLEGVVLANHTNSLNGHPTPFLEAAKWCIRTTIDLFRPHPDK